MRGLRAKMGEAQFELDRCMGCGLCLDDCPTYNATGRSTSSPRGRIRLMRNLIAGAIDLGDTVPYTNVSVQHELESCLGCLGCETSCPADIRYSEMLDALRTSLFESDPKYAEQLSALLKDIPVGDPQKLRRVTLCLGIAQRLGLIWILRHTPLRNLLSPHRRSMVSLLAKKIPRRPSSSVLARDNPAIGKKRMTVGVFLGCVNDHMFTEANVAMVRVLQRLGADVIVPESQACCGAIHRHMGEVETAKAMAVKNCRRFVDAEVDMIAVNAAGCGAMTKGYTRVLADDPVIREIGPKFKDVHEVIWQLLEMTPAFKERFVWPGRRARYTYQDACHLVHGQGISDIPRKLLGCIRGLEYVPLNESARCCGSAGTYNILQPGLAEAIQARKISNILATGADIVAIGNPGCALQIMSGLSNSHRRGMTCCHPVELLEKSWRST